MSMDGPVAVRGIAAYALRFDFTASIGPIRAADRTASWIDLARMSSLRFEKQERNPVIGTAVLTLESHVQPHAHRTVQGQALSGARPRN